MKCFRHRQSITNQKLSGHLLQQTSNSNCMINPRNEDTSTFTVADDDNDATTDFSTIIISETELKVFNNNNNYPPQYHGIPPPPAFVNRSLESLNHIIDHSNEQKLQ